MSKSSIPGCKLSLSKRFRAKMRDGLQKADLYRQIPAAAWRQAWAVHSKSVGHGAKAVAYFADYVFRIGIANQRIVKLEFDAVIFWYKARKTNRRVFVTPPDERMQLYTFNGQA